MTAVINISSVKETALWNHLDTAFQDTPQEQDANFLAANLITLCQEASNRMRLFPSFHSQYTLHDNVHLLRVTELMAKLIPEATLDVLNPIEIALLILSAHFHDQGMIISTDEYIELENNPDYQVFRRNWELNHPNLVEIQQELSDVKPDTDASERLKQQESELRDQLLSDYLRSGHGRRSEEYVLDKYQDDPRLEVQSVNLAALLARLCKSHVLPTEELSPGNGYNFDESIGQYRVNVPYLALILRLADILDFDRDRTPDILFRSIHFTSSFSVKEWEKHRSVQGWVIEEDHIRFTMEFSHPAYEKATREFMDYIDRELIAATLYRRSFPESVSGYKLAIPQQVDRSRLTARNGEYIYHDLEFHLTRDEITKLLMEENLYGSPSLCIRELLQNSLDALRHRRALHLRDAVSEPRDLKVKFQHFLDEHGCEVVSCSDNGVGMDQDSVTKFLTQVGRSYYKSPEFAQERVSFQAKGVDFDPCSQFGIGFMSCFMLGDQITILTRKDMGPAKGRGEPLKIEINGIGGLLIIRPGKANQPIGTTVRITGRKKPRFMDEWEDQVMLLEVLDGYAIAPDFPIEADCAIEGLTGSIEIPAEIAQSKTVLEHYECKNIRIYKQSRISHLEKSSLDPPTSFNPMNKGCS